MRSQIDRSCPPTKREYYLTMHEQPIHIQCQTHISEAPISCSQSHEQPYIQNFYCYTLNSQLVKVTKIRIGQELVTMVDRMSFNHEFPKEESKSKSSGSASPQEVYTSSETSNKKLRLSVVARALLRMFEQWIKQHEPELLSILQQIKENSLNETELKQNLSYDFNLREAFICFNEYISSLKIKKSLLKVVDNWEKVILPAHDTYLRNEEFLNNIFSVKEENN